MTFHSYETIIMDRADAGMKASDIAEETGYSLKTVQGVMHRLVVGGAADEWMRSARTGSDALLRSIRSHHPDRCAQ